MRLPAAVISAIACLCLNWSIFSQVPFPGPGSKAAGGGVGGTVAFVQTAGTTGGNVSSIAVDLTTPPTTGSGRYIVTTVKWGDGSGTINQNTPTDDGGNTYTCEAKQRDATLLFSFRTCRAPITTGGSAFTVTVGFSAATDQGYTSLRIFEISGANASAPSEGCATLATGGVDNGYTSAASLTTTVANGFLVSMAITSGSTPAAGTGWTDTTEGDIYRTTTTTGAYPALRTDTGNMNWAVTNCGFKP